MNPAQDFIPGCKVLVTCDQWFYAPNGRQYKAVWGTVKAVRTAEESLGIRPNGRSTNWYIDVGCMRIAGCQVHYIVRCDQCSFEPSIDWATPGDAGTEAKVYERPSSIFNADEVHA